MTLLPSIFDFSTPIIAAILGIAFPLIMHTITTIDTKYGSKRLNGRFKKEKDYIQLYVALTIAIVASVYNLLVVIPWRYDCCIIVNWIMANSSNLILIGGMLYLIYILFKVIILQTTYMDFISLFENLHCTAKKDNYKSKEDILDFVEIGKHVMLRDDNEKSRDFYQFLLDYTQHKVGKPKSHKNKPLEYDDWFYNTILTVNHELLKTNQIPNSVRNGAEFVKLLFSQPAELAISEKTYNILWRALQQQLNYKKTDWIYSYWANAYQYRWLVIRSNKHLFSYNPTEDQKAEIERRNKQIRQFDEFHIALCGYVLYLKEYDLIKDMTSYTQTEPYQYPLVPSSFIDILVEFKNVIELEFDNPFEFDNRFGFPGVLGVNAGRTSSAWYKRYLALLLFRLNSFEVKYMSSWQNQWEMPNASDPNEIKDLIEISEQIKRFVEWWDLDENKEVLERMGWEVEREGEETDDINVADRRIDPYAKLEDFISSLKGDYESALKNLTHSKAKYEYFSKTAKAIIKKSSVIYKNILTACSESELMKQIEEEAIVKGIINVSQTRIDEKKTFSDDITSTHLNYHEIDAQIAEKDLIIDYSLNFYNHAKRIFYISSDDLLKALDRLIDGHLENYEVISFGDYFYTFRNEQNRVLKLMKEIEEEYEYKNRTYLYKDKLKISVLPSPQHEIMNSTVFIIKKDDMPCYEHVKPTEELISEYQLKPVDDDSNELELYTSVIFNNFPNTHKSIENSDKCLVALYYCIRMFWKKDSDVTMLNLLTPFVDSGKGMDVNELPVLKG